MTKWPLVQPDLFEERRKSLPAPQRVKAVELLQAAAGGSDGAADGDRPARKAVGGER